MAVHHLEQLAERVRAIEAAGDSPGDQAGRVPTGWAEVDVALEGGLMAGAVHEWFAGEGKASAEWRGGGGRGGGGEGWHAPLGVLMHLVRQAMWDDGWSVWVGRRCWPYEHGLVGAGQDGGDGGEMLGRCLWVDPADGAGRLWAVDVAARCAGVSVVVADGSGLDMAATRRLQLAAEAGGTLVLLARPGFERKALSAATTRWGVQPVVSAGRWPRWEVDLWRCKGSQRGRAREGQQRWLLEGTWSRGQGFVVLPAEPGDRSKAADVGAVAGAGPSPSRVAQQRRA